MSKPINLERYKVYTDGSCEPNPGIGGWAFEVWDNDIPIHAGSGADKDTTNNRMEMLAVAKALEWMNENKPFIPFLLYSDSQYVLSGITSWTKKWALKGWMLKATEPVKNEDLWKLILSNTRYYSDFEWVKAHVGDKFNDRVDKLAEQARAALSASLKSSGNAPAAMTYRRGFVRSWQVNEPENI